MKQFKILVSELLQGKRLTSARELHERLKNKTDFSTWFKRRAEEAMLNEGVDFVQVKDKDGVFPKNGENLGGRPSVDFALTDEAVSHICMLERTAIGREIRTYFIERHKKLQLIENGKNQLALPQNYEQALEELLKKVKENNRLEQKNLLLEDKIEKEKPSVEYANSVGTNENTKNLQEGIKQLFNYIKKVNNAIKVLVDKRVLFRADEQNCSSPIVKFSADFNDVFKSVPIKTRTKNVSTQVLLRVTPTAKAKLEKYIGIDAQPFLYANSIRKVAEVKLKIKNELFQPQN